MANSGSYPTSSGSAGNYTYPPITTSIPRQAVPYIPMSVSSYHWPDPTPAPPQNLTFIKGVIMAGFRAMLLDRLWGICGATMLPSIVGIAMVLEFARVPWLREFLLGMLLIGTPGFMAALIYLSLRREMYRFAHEYLDAPKPEPLYSFKEVYAAMLETLARRREQEQEKGQASKSADA